MHIEKRKETSLPRYYLIDFERNCYLHRDCDVRVEVIATRDFKKSHIFDDLSKAEQARDYLNKKCSVYNWRIMRLC